MEKIVKGRKVYQCSVCDGNIQKGEKHIRQKIVAPRFDDNEIQIGIEYFEYRHHDKDCGGVLMYGHAKNILKNCNKGNHLFGYDNDPDRNSDLQWCEWCGKKIEQILKTTEL